MAEHASTQRHKDQIQVSCSPFVSCTHGWNKARTGMSRRDLSDAVRGYIYDELPFALRKFLFVFLPYRKVIQEDSEALR